jgi:uncharacterized membrane protein HdeD (DUF308 family)
MHPEGSSMERRAEVWLAVRGVVAIVFGVLAIIWPGLTILALALLFGAYVLIDGVGMLIDAFRGRRTGAQRAAYLLRALLGIGVGVITLVWPGITAFVLVIMVGAWAVVTGAIGIWAASVARPGWLLVLVGVLSLIAGVLILVRPNIGAVAIAQVIGIYAIIAGVLMLIETWRLHRATQPTNRPAAAGI